MPQTLSPTLASRVTRLASALRQYADDPFASSLAERLDLVLVAPDPRLGARELLGPSDLVGIERFRPADEARVTMIEMVCGDLAPRADGAPHPLGEQLLPLLWSLAVVGMFWLGWFARGAADVAR